MVRPDNTDDQRCIGARGNMSLLHVSKSGITLALQVCIIQPNRYVIMSSQSGYFYPDVKFWNGQTPALLMLSLCGQDLQILQKHL